MRERHLRQLEKRDTEQMRPNIAEADNIKKKKKKT